MDYPLFTIVTVCYNVVNEISATIDSIASQTLTDYEYLIVDGGSCDHTLSFIDKYVMIFQSQKISLRIISEADTGIYNAMNKAIDLAHGKWLIYLNAGDIFYCPNVLEWLKPSCEETGYDVVYGDTIIANAGLYKYQQVELSTQAKPMPYCHQSCATRHTLLQRYRFDEHYRISADYDLYVRSWQDGCRSLYIPKPISIFAAGGFSGHHYLELLQEHNEIGLQHGLLLPHEAERIINDYHAQNKLPVKEGPCTWQEKWKLMLRSMLPSSYIKWRQERQARQRMLKSGWTYEIPGIPQANATK